MVRLVFGLALPVACAASVGRPLAASYPIGTPFDPAGQVVPLRKVGIDDALLKAGSTGSAQVSSWINEKCMGACKGDTYARQSVCVKECQNEMYGCLDKEEVPQGRCIEEVEGRYERYVNKEPDVQMLRRGSHLSEEQTKHNEGGVHVLAHSDAHMQDTFTDGAASGFECGKQCLLDMYMCADKAPHKALYRWTKPGVDMLQFGELDVGMGNPAAGDILSNKDLELSATFGFPKQTLVDRALIVKEPRGYHVRQCLREVKTMYKNKAPAAWRTISH